MREAFIGLLLFFFLQMATTAMFVAGAVASGNELQLEDAGEDVFDAMSMMAEWSDERLADAANGEKLSGRPAFFADLDTLKIGFGTTLLLDIVAVPGLMLATRLGPPRRFLRELTLDRFSFDDLWVPILAVIGAYVAVVAYSVAATASGIDWLEPRSNVPIPIRRETLTMAIAFPLIAIAAPFAEEVFFRGVLFRGLLRWGFWPAGAISAFLFSAAHLSIGAVIPFFIVGLVLAWVFWRRGRLWESIAFHFLFNTVSYILLALGAGDV